MKVKVGLDYARRVVCVERLAHGRQDHIEVSKHVFGLFWGLVLANGELQKAPNLDGAPQIDEHIDIVLAKKHGPGERLPRD